MRQVATLIPIIGRLKVRFVIKLKFVLPFYDVQVELSTFGRTLNIVPDNSEPLCLMVQTSGDSGKTWKLEKCNNSSKYICEYPAFGTRLGIV